jgi:hypothetical protein
MSYDYIPVMAKGADLETRLINDVGMQGNWCGVGPTLALLDSQMRLIPVVELRTVCRKYSDVYPNVTHNPMKELEFFDTELKMAIRGAWPLA